MSPSEGWPTELVVDAHTFTISSEWREGLLVRCARHGETDPVSLIFSAIDAHGFSRLRPCSVCPCFVAMRDTGRPPHTCSAACRQAARRRQQRGHPIGDNGEREPLRFVPYPGGWVPSTLSDGWEWLWLRLTPAGPDGSAEAWPASMRREAADSLPSSPIYWRRVTPRRDGTDLILYESLHRDLGLLRVRANDTAAGKTQLTLLVGAVGTEFQIDLHHWPKAWMIKGDRRAGRIP